MFSLVPVPIIRCATRVLSAIISDLLLRLSFGFVFQDRIAEYAAIMTIQPDNSDETYRMVFPGIAVWTLSFGRKCYFAKKLAIIQRAKRVAASPQVSFSMKSTERAAPNIWLALALRKCCLRHLLLGSESGSQPSKGRKPKQ